MKRLIILFLSLLFLTTCSALAEKDIEWYSGDNEVYNSRGEHFVYEVVDDHAVLTCYWMEKDKPQPPVVEIPDTLNDYPLTAIGWCAFDNWDACDWLEGQWQTYDGNQVECIVIPEGVITLENGAFCWAEDIRAISLPSSLTEIHTGLCFEGVYAQISFPNGNDCYYVENGFLIDNEQNALIYCDLNAWQHPLPRVKRIEAHALDNYNCKLSVLEFPDSVEYIGEYNGYDCVNLETIIVPGSVVEIADSGLRCNSATSIILNEGLRKIGAFAFSETAAGEIIVPASVEWIGYGAFMWEGLSPIVQNPDVIWETEAQYNSRFWAETTINDEVVYTSAEWPLRTLEIIKKETGGEFLRITMQDESGLMFVSTLLPEFFSFDEYHAGDTVILMCYPVGLPEQATQEDADEAETYFLTFQYINEDWWLTNATNGWDWILHVENGVFRFNDYYNSDKTWLWQPWVTWEIENAGRLSEFFFDDLEKLAAAYNEAMPNRYSLHPELYE